MDVVKQKKKKLITKKMWVGGLTFAAIIGFVFIMGKISNASYIADGDKLILANVERGEFTAKINGTGVLLPKKVQWVGAIADGRIRNIYHQAGDRVNEGDILIELYNPELLQQYEETQWELKAQIAEAHADKIKAESELLDLEANIANAELDYRNAKIKLDAQTELKNSGVLGVTAVEYEGVKISVEQYKNRWEIQKQRTQKMRENIVAQQESKKARLEKMRNTLNQVKNKLDGLTVKATTSGVLQEMQLELGQQVQIGDNVTKIAQHDQLIAQLKIQEIQIRDIAIGQKVVIDTRSNKINGVVSRIDPVVSSGTVLVDVDLVSELPVEARPDLTVEGAINISEIEDTLYVKRPVFANGHGTMSVYRLVDNGDAAERITIEFGMASTNNIQVKNGLLEGDTIIISDPSDFENHQRIIIN